jgi:hypothetical protein
LFCSDRFLVSFENRTQPSAAKARRRDQLKNRGKERRRLFFPVPGMRVPASLLKRPTPLRSSTVQTSVAGTLVPVDPNFIDFLPKILTQEVIFNR